MGMNDGVVQNEYEKERIRGVHLAIVLVYTFAVFAVAGESILMGWELFMLPLFVVGLVTAWWLHLSQALSDKARYYIYVILIYIAMFFHAIHETSLFDVAITANLCILLFSQIDDEKVIRAGVAIYAMILAYHLAINLTKGSVATDSLTVSRMALHIVSVILTSRLALIIIRRRKNDTRNYEVILKSLSDANTRTENFMANISHELRTPINVVTGMTSILLKDEKDAGRLEQLDAVNKAGRKLFDQIGGILDYTEIDSDRLIITNENYMMSSVINDLINEITIFEKRRDLEIIFDVDAELPRLLFGDAKRIKKILHLLIDNAVKFTKEGGVFIRIYSFKREYGINLCIDVIDTGIGISAEEIGRIKQGFYQSDGGRDRRAGGIGLGLPIVYGFVHLMNGFVKIDSNEGSGTKVHISIPQQVADPSPSVSVDNAGDLCIACYLRPEKYKHPAIRDYYSELISDIVKGLKVNLHRIAKKEDLDKVFNAYAVTHIFIGAEEYMQAPEYFEEMAEKTRVIVVADENFRPRAGSFTEIIKKPFYVLPVAAALNSTARKDEFDNDMLYGRLQPVFKGVKALVVDDEEMNLVVAGGIFRNYQMEVDVAGSGAEAISMCNEKDYDIVFMDHMMPEMDGIEAMKRIREQTRLKGKVPVIVALTANAVSGAREMFIAEGFDGFVAKPVDTIELIRVLRRVLPQSVVSFVKNDDASALENNNDSRYYDRDEAIGNNGSRYYDREEALRYCDGDEALLKKLTDIFVEEMDEKLAGLKKLSGLVDGNVHDRKENDGYEYDREDCDRDGCDRDECDREDCDRDGCDSDECGREEYDRMIGRLACEAKLLGLSELNSLLKDANNIDVVKIEECMRLSVDGMSGGVL